MGKRQGAKNQQTVALNKKRNLGERNEQKKKLNKRRNLSRRRTYSIKYLTVRTYTIAKKKTKRNLFNPS